MGILSFLFGGTATNALIDRLNPPTIVFRNTDYVCKGLSPSGYDKWMFAYGRRDNKKRKWIKLKNRIDYIDKAGGIDIYWN